MSGCSHQHPSSLCSMSSTEGEDAHHFSSTTQSTTEAKIDPGPTPSTSSKAGEPCALVGEDPNTPAAYLPSWDSYSEGIRPGTRCRPLCRWRVLVSHRKVLCASRLGGGGRGFCQNWAVHCISRPSLSWPPSGPVEQQGAETWPRPLPPPAPHVATMSADGAASRPPLHRPA